jgi:ribonuclease BN (tRNA processing enzyme)
MDLKVLGSGSSGNCYLLENETECLVIEAGLPYKEVKKALDFNTRKIVGVIISHRHVDHAGYLKDYAMTGIPYYKPYEFGAAVCVPQPRVFGKFNVIPFGLFHDVPCYGFYITHPDIGIFVYASDTEYIKFKFSGVNHFLIEANYSMEYVDKDVANYEHVLKGHMNIDTTCRFLEKNKSSSLKTATLCHLSAHNADSDSFRARAEEIVDCKVNVAVKGLKVNLDLIPDWMK